MKNLPIPVFLTPRQIVTEMGIDYRHFLKKLARGQGPKFKRYGAQYRIRKDWYEKWLDADENHTA